MEVSPSNIANFDGEGKALKGLLEAFGSMFSREEIASAYCKVGRNADLAGQILCGMQGSSSTSSNVLSNGEVRNEELFEQVWDNTPKKSCYENGKFRTVKQKGRSVSVGTVSSVLGKDYVKPFPVTNCSGTGTKPLKLDAKDVPMSELWEEETKRDPLKDDRMRKDMEDFVFKMLGDGFELDRDKIHRVLEACGYDMGKSMEKLLDISAGILDKKNEYVGKCTEKFTDSCPISKGSSYHEKWQPRTFTGGNTSRVSNTNGEELCRQEKERNELEKEVLVSLFNATERSEELTRRTAKASRRSMLYGEPVAEPPRDLTLERVAKPVDLQQDNDKDEEEKLYLLLRKAVREHRVTMREYYKAAVDSFAKGDYNKANKLMEEGHSFREKALVADEESSQMIFETNVDTKDEMELDLHDHGAREAIRTLKIHLSSLSGIPSLKYLKVIIETNEEDSTKGARRRLVVKLLEKESIKWSEGGKAGTILIDLDSVNRKR